MGRVQFESDSETGNTVNQGIIQARQETQTPSDSPRAREREG